MLRQTDYHVPENDVMTIEFDPIGYAQQLEAAGVSRHQAEVHAKALNEVASEGVSTSDGLHMKNDWQCAIRQSEDRLTAHIDLAKTELSAELQTFRAESNEKYGVLDAKIDGVRTELSAKIDGVRTGLSAKIDGIRTELSAQISLLDAKIEVVRMNLNTKCECIQTELNAKIDSVRTDLTAKIEILAAELRSIKHELAIHRWLFGLLIVMNGTIIARLYFP